MSYPVRKHLAMMALFAAAFLLTANARAGDTDSHFSQNSSGQLFQRSVFAHGYIHGYEEGFHWGNLDFQTGRGSSRPREARACKSSYEKTFGSRTKFKTGYHRGFTAGYYDGLDGREFRGHELTRQAAQELPESAGDTKKQAAFDAGLSDGYELGSVRGQNASRDYAAYNASTELCSAKEHRPLYCSGFERGFAMGYSDGFLVNSGKTPSPTRAASK